jgi:hypothetical protein
MEVYDPLDMMWIAHTYGMVDRRNGPRYARCANHPGCERFVPAPWPRGQGRPPRFCEPSCDAKGRDLAGHKRRKKDYDDKCREMLRTAWQSLPAKERKFDRDQQRRLMATKLFKFVRKQLAKIPGVRGERWIAKQLKREEFSGENQRAGKE